MNKIMIIVFIAFFTSCNNTNLKDSNRVAISIDSLNTMNRKVKVNLDSLTQYNCVDFNKFPLNDSIPLKGKVLPFKLAHHDSTFSKFGYWYGKSYLLISAEAQEIIDFDIKDERLFFENLKVNMPLDLFRRNFPDSYKKIEEGKWYGDSLPKVRFTYIFNCPPNSLDKIVVVFRENKVSEIFYRPQESFEEDNN